MNSKYVYNDFQVESRNIQDKLCHFAVCFRKWKMEDITHCRQDSTNVQTEWRKQGILLVYIVLDVTYQRMTGEENMC